MSNLPDFITAVMTNRGLRRQGKLIALRTYIKNTTTTDMMKAIKQITYIHQLKILWEAGLTTPLQQAVTARIEELAQRRQP